MPIAHGLKILLVEDHSDVAAAMMVVLKLLGHNGACARTVGEAVEQARAQSFDVILADFTLPDGTANDLAGRLKAASLSAPIILLTAHNPDNLPIHVQKTFAGCLQKPVDLDALDAMLQTFAAAHPV